MNTSAQSTLAVHTRTPVHLLDLKNVQLFHPQEESVDQVRTPQGDVTVENNQDPFSSFSPAQSRSSDEHLFPYVARY